MLSESGFAELKDEQDWSAISEIPESSELQCRQQFGYLRDGDEGRVTAFEAIQSISAAKAGIQLPEVKPDGVAWTFSGTEGLGKQEARSYWIPAFAGMTGSLGVTGAAGMTTLCGNAGSPGMTGLWECRVSGNDGFLGMTGSLRMTGSSGMTGPLGMMGSLGVVGLCRTPGGERDWVERSGYLR